MFDPNNASGVYAFVNHSVGRVYIGQTMTTFAQRWRDHRNKLAVGQHRNQDLQIDWQADPQCFDFVIIQAFQPRLHYGLVYPIRELERFLVQSSDCWLYNVSERFQRIDNRLIAMLDAYIL